jgi:hypothetical protein
MSTPKLPTAEELKSNAQNPIAKPPVLLDEPQLRYEWKRFCNRLGQKSTADTQLLLQVDLLLDTQEPPLLRLVPRQPSHKAVVTKYLPAWETHLAAVPAIVPKIELSEAEILAPEGEDSPQKRWEALRKAYPALEKLKDVLGLELL